MKRKRTIINDLFNQWIDVHKISVTTSTINGYISAYNHLRPIAFRSIESIQYRDLQAIIDDMRQAGLSYASCKKVRSLINQLYKFAIVSGVQVQQYGSFLKLGMNNVKSPHKTISRRAINRLWLSPTDNALVLILLYTGLRCSELLNLTKKDVNLKRKTLNITTAKTKAGIRIIPIHDRIYPLVKALYECSTTQHITDTVRTYTALNRYFRKRLPRHRLHDTRHTFASLLDDADVNYNAKRRLLGHASSNITDGVYTHKGLRSLRKAINKLK